MTIRAMTIRVVQWGTGTAGLRALRCVLGNPTLELAGLYVARPERAGRDAGSFVGLPDTGVIATNSIADLLGIEADCLCYMGSFTHGGIDDILRFLRSGRNVVTTTLFSLLTPHFAPAADRDAVTAACREGGSSFLSTGASPGFCTDLFPVTMLGIVDEIEQIKIQEIADYSNYPVVEVARSWGFGAAPGSPIPLLESGALEREWSAVPKDIARRIGLPIDAIRIVGDQAVARRDVPTTFYTIPAGTVSAIRFEVQAISAGQPRIVHEHVNYCSFDDIPDGWAKPATRTRLAYRTTVTGRPNMTAEIALDYPIAAIRMVNAIPAVVAAAPGILSGADVPPLGSGNIKRF